MTDWLIALGLAAVGLGVGYLVCLGVQWLGAKVLGKGKVKRDE